MWPNPLANETTVHRRIPTVIARELRRLCFDMPWSDDLLKASAVFLVVGLFLLVLFSGQIFLIYQIETRHLSRRQRQQPEFDGAARSWRPAMDAVREQHHK
jgi:hypothetical protein